MRLTPDGISALWNAQSTGVSATLTHIQLGTGHKLLTGLETALLTPVQVTAIGSGSKPSPTQIRIAGVFPGNANYDFSEVGIFIGHPASGGKLFAYYAVETGKIGTMVQGTDFVFSHEWTMSATDAAMVTIMADTGQSAMLAMLAEHENKLNPHGQYALTTGNYPNLRAGSVGSMDTSSIWNDARASMLKLSIGYRVAPDGYVEQWGITGDIANDSTIAVTFPLAFGVCVGVYPTAMSDSGNFDHFPLLVSYNSTGAVLGRGWITGNSANKKLLWHAKGWI